MRSSRLVEHDAAEPRFVPPTPFLTEDAPLRALAEAFGFRVSGSLRTGRVRIFSDVRGRKRREIVIVPGIPRALINGRGVPLLRAPRFVGGQLIVPPELADILRRMGRGASPTVAPSSGRPSPRRKPKTAFLPMTTDHTALLLAGGAGGANESGDLKAPAAGSRLSRVPEQKTAKTKKAEADEPAGMSRVGRKSRGFVLIDPGHGGKDEGACGPKGTKEKDVVLGIAKLLARELRSGGVRADLTRTGDSFVPLSTRAATANRLEPDIFISLHVNSYPKSYVTGIETWVAAPSGKQRQATAITESTEAEQHGEPEVAGLGLRRARPKRKFSRAARPLPSVSSVSPPPGGQALGFTRRMRASRSAALATRVQAALVKATGERDRGVRASHFTVLRRSKVPAVLVEAGFISNPKTEKRLGDASYRGKIAKALAHAIMESGLLRERVVKQD